MRAVHNVLIIGGGTAGMAAAISLRALGIGVDLVERDPDWQPDGAGLSTNAAMMRSLDRLGLLDDFLKVGHAGEGMFMRRPDGEVLSQMPTAGVAREGVPGVGGILRADLARLMAERTRACGTRVFLGQTITAMRDTGDAVDVETSDGRCERYDLVVAADGCNSKVRASLFPDAPAARYVGQAVWRAVLPRPEGIDTIHVWIGAKGIKPGINPISPSHVYLFISEDQPEKRHVDQATAADQMRALLEPFSCPVLQRLRDQLHDGAMINYRPIEDHLLRGSWHKGRIVLIGDAAHSTTPQLTSGAMMAAEDGIVLAEEVSAGGSVEEILSRFFNRRFERCRMVVENAARLSALEIEGGRQAEIQQTMRESTLALARPI